MGILSPSEIIRKYELLTHKGHSKKLGQNFLINDVIPKRIVESFLRQFSLKEARAEFAPLDESFIFEVGPGAGVLSRELLRLPIKRLVSIEKDQRCVQALTEELFPFFKDRFCLTEGDALSFSIRDYMSPFFLEDKKNVHVIANLPYNIGTVLLTRWLKKSFIASMTLMLQKEVVDRMVAKPGSKNYGRLSILVQYAANPLLFFHVSPSFFKPAPKVISSVVYLDIKQDIDFSIIPYLEIVTRICFSNRRKMLRKSLKGMGLDEKKWQAVLAESDIPDTERAENLPVMFFVNLARVLSANSIDTKERK